MVLLILTFSGAALWQRPSAVAREVFGPRLEFRAPRDPGHGRQGLRALAKAEGRHGLSATRCCWKLVFSCFVGLFVLYKFRGCQQKGMVLPSAFRSFNTSWFCCDSWGCIAKIIELFLGPKHATTSKRTSKRTSNNYRFCFFSMGGGVWGVGGPSLRELPNKVLSSFVRFPFKTKLPEPLGRRGSIYSGLLGASMFI